MTGAWLVGWLLVGGVDPTPGTETLPVVVLVGDSIRMGYSEVVADRLRGRARVISSAENGSSSRKVLHHLDEWVIRHRPAVVHFGAGLHDIMTDPHGGAKIVEAAEYHANLRRIVRRLTDETSARLIFATTTPVIESRRVGADFLLREADVRAYNDLASRVLATSSVVAVDDLHAGAIAFGLERALSEDGVHFTRAGFVALGEQVAAAVASSLADPPLERQVACRRTAIAPRIDGRVEGDPGWERSTVVSAFPRFWTGEPMPNRTAARLAWDDEALYFSARMVDDQIVAVGSRPNDRVWLGDAFGLVVQPDEDALAAFEFQVNPAGGALELAMPDAGADFASLATQPGLGMVAASVTWEGRRGQPRGWAMEGRIPWSAFDRVGGRPAPGASWRATMFRFDSNRIGSKPVLTSSAPLRRPDVHRLSESSWLRFEP